MRMRWGLLVVTSAVVAMAPLAPAGAIQLAVESSSSTAAPRAAIKASAVLKTLRVATERTSGYNRDYFHHWIDADHDRCDTRREVLYAEAIARPSVYGSCSFSGGRWFSAYDGITQTDPSTFDIDHFVPLAEAWGSGAWRWSYTTRETYANDLGYAGSLIAVSASSNRSKSDRDPAEWLPLRWDYRCTYASTWIAVKYRWGLSVDRAEKLALRSLVSSCGNPRITLPPKASVTIDPVETGGGSGGTGGSSGGGSLDPRFGTCTEAKSYGYGPYVRGVDPEYDWYRDGDSDGTVCE